MSKAGKVADILSSFMPVNLDYRNSDKTVYVAGKTRDHEMAISEMPSKAIIVKSFEEALKLRAPKDGLERGVL